MRIKVKSISVQGIRSFRRRVDIPVGEADAGLHYLFGRNLVDRNLGANGTGKTTLWCVLCWILFNRYSKSLRSTEMVSWNLDKDTQVKASCVFYVDDKEIVVERSRNPNRLLINGKAADQEDLLRIFVIPLDAFMHSVYIGQNVRMFMDYSPSEKASLLSNILGLDVWLKYRAYAKERKKQLHYFIQDKKSKIDKISGKIDGLLDLSYSSEIEDWDRTRRKNKRDLVKSIKEDEVEFEAVCMKLKLAEKAYTKLCDVDMKYCSKCGQALREHGRSIEVDKANVKRDLRALRDEKLALEVSIEKTERDLDNLSNENPWRKKQETINTSIRTLRAERIEYVEIVRSKEKVIAKLEYWIKGFIDIRLWLIGSVLRRLKNECSSYLIDLGLDGWSIDFVLDKETESGGIVHGFYVNVFAPGHPESVSWEVWSGGERQRLSLAVTMALSSVIQDIYSVYWDIEIWDEPCTWLSEDGINMLLETLRKRSIRDSKSIWVTDHRSIGSRYFDQCASIVKEETGSYFQWDG